MESRSVAELLAEAKAAGLTLLAEGEDLVVRGPRRAAEALAGRLRDRKGEVLAVLRAGGVGNSSPVGPPTPPPEAKAEADRLLADLRAYVARVKAVRFAGQFPPPLGSLAADLLSIGEGYVAGWALEASRGWDPLSLLRELRRAAEDILSRPKAARV
jgi:hypothetical protein